jgi:hypothetical protein
MSRTSKKLNREKRLQKKRARKAANRARYAELARTGQNQKSKRFLAGNKKRKTVKLVDHKNGPCGNLACKKCFPSYNKAA